MARAPRPPGSDSGGTETTCSPRTRSAWRLVTSSFRPGQSARSSTSVGAGDGDLLEVVEDEQDLLRAELAAELVERRALRGVAEAERRRDQGEDGVGVGRGDEVDEVDAVGEPVDLVGGGPDARGGSCRCRRARSA